MKNNYLILTTLFLSLFLVSCSKEDIAPPPPVVFENLSASKNLSFTNDAITLNIEGSDFTDIEFIFSDEALTSTKIDETTYEIKSSKALLGNVRVDLTNGDDIQTKIIDLEFVEHGVFNSNIVEGIRIDRDSSDRLLEVLGEPDLKFESISGNSIFWFYSFGVVFTEVKANKRITSSTIYSGSRVIRSEGNEDLLVQPYPYLINETFDFSDSELNTMDEIVNVLKLPSVTHTDGPFPDFISSLKRELVAPSTERRGFYSYVYFYNNNNDFAMAVNFSANGIDAYEGEFISTITFL